VAAAVSLQGDPSRGSPPCAPPAQRAPTDDPACLDSLHIDAYSAYVESLCIVVAESSRSDLLQGTLDLLLLQVVALGPLHGYAIGQRLQQITKDTLQVQQGSLYPALHRLEHRGWLRAEWRPSETGRDAKFYSLTRKGRTQLAAERLNWKRLAQAIALVLRTAD